MPPNSKNKVTVGCLTLILHFSTADTCHDPVTILSIHYSLQSFPTTLLQHAVPTACSGMDVECLFHLQTSTLLLEWALCTWVWLPTGICWHGVYLWSLVAGHLVVSSYNDIMAHSHSLLVMQSYYRLPGCIF